MVEFQSDLLRISSENLLHQRMICAAARALVVSEFHERQRCVFRPTNVPAAPKSKDVGARRRRSGFWRLIGLTAQINGCAGCHCNRQDNDNERLKRFRHALILAAPVLFMKKYLALAMPQGENSRVSNRGRIPSSSWLLQPGTVVGHVGLQDDRSGIGFPNEEDVV